MEKDIERFYELRAAKYSCSQVMVEMALEATEQENEQLVQAMAGLRGGCMNGLLCGAFSGACCAIAMLCPEDMNEMQAQLKEWFAEHNGRNGSLDCDVIIMGDAANKPLICPKVIESTYREMKELLEDAGVDMSSHWEE